jgi:hypothetical protein
MIEDINYKEILFAEIKGNYILVVQNRLEEKP